MIAPALIEVSRVDLHFVLGGGWQRNQRESRHSAMSWRGEWSSVGRVDRRLYCVLDGGARWSYSKRILNLDHRRKANLDRVGKREDVRCRVPDG